MARLYGPGPEPPPPLIATTDLAGLSTADVDGRPVGELVGALSEETSGLIRYLDVAIRGAERHVLVPIGHTRIDGESVPPRVRLRAATQGDLLSIPAFTGGGPIDHSYHERVLSAHGRLFYGSRYYAHPSYDHSALAVGEAAVSVDGDEEAGTGLRPLSELEGVRLARGAPALLGWRVHDRAGEEIGEITDLLVQAATSRARYAVIELDGLERATALPIGYVEADAESSTARLPTLSEEDLRLLPAYQAPLTRAGENRIHTAIEGRLTGERYFERPDFQGVTPESSRS